MPNPPNPHGSNQHVEDPRRKLFWDLYLDPKSETFSNAYQSGMKAGYTEDTSSRITTQDWFTDKIRKLNLVKKAEKVLDKTLDYDPVDSEGKVNVPLVAVQTRVSEIVVTRLGKYDGWSEKKDDALEKIADKINVISFREKE